MTRSLVNLHQFQLSGWRRGPWCVPGVLCWDNHKNLVLLTYDGFNLKLLSFHFWRSDSFKKHTKKKIIEKTNFTSRDRCNVKFFKPMSKILTKTNQRLNFYYCFILSQNKHDLRGVGMYVCVRAFFNQHSAFALSQEN